MPFDPASWLQVASKLMGGGVDAPEQARFRTVLNRAYYAALLVLCARIEEVQGEGTVPTVMTHSAVRRALANTRNRHLLKVKQRLDTLCDDRESADYELGHKDFAQQHAEAAIERARRVVQDIKFSLQDKHLRSIKF